MKTLQIIIGDKEVQVKSFDDLPVSITYELEDPENFQAKSSATSLGLKIPATLMNDEVANQFFNPASTDTTPGQIFRGNQKCVVAVGSQEILVGKAFLQSATHADRPLEYEYNLYGDNAAWLIDLKEKTLYDFLSHISFVFDKDGIVSSWAFDGRNESLPYVFAPVRYRRPMGDYNTVNNQLVPVDDNMKPIYMRPSLSKYWILYWAFKSVGFKIQSTFFDSDYFRRQVMPWTWGSFLSSEGTNLDVHRFLAKGTKREWVIETFKGYIDLDVTVDNNNSVGAFDNNDDYSYDKPNMEMKWQYKPNQSFGVLTAHFSLAIDVRAGSSGGVSHSLMHIHWYHKDSLGNTLQFKDDLIVEMTPGRSMQDIVYSFYEVDVNPGDFVVAKVYADVEDGKNSTGWLEPEVLEFKLDFLRVPLGGTISFSNLEKFKNHKFLDYFKGVIDEFNLSLNTDPVNKIVVIEPTHPHAVDNDFTVTSPGYFVDDFIDWSEKGDYSKEWKMENFADYEREVVFQYKDDSNDGVLKKIQDRYVTTLAQAKYVFPDRFKQGKKQVENRFFSPVMHYEVELWKSLGTGANTGITPQMICVIPENISNTSASEAEHLFQPKSAYYKGLVTGAGAWKFDGEVLQAYPFMFAVNYQPGGQDDPILSYSDEKIGNDASGFVIGKGLLKRFYWQRLAVMRNGQWYNAWFHLNNFDVTGLHREYKRFKGQRYELVQIKDYKPLVDGSTACFLRRWAPVEQIDADNTFPSNNNVLNPDTPSSNSFDMKYTRLKCLITDIPT